jgi:long-chain acyl-CoA synthetase
MGELNFGRVLRRAKMYGEKLAIKDLGNAHEASYSEQIDRVARLCSVISKLGASSTDRVAVLAGGSHVYVELWQACLAGAAVINPLNPRLASDELAYVLADSQSKLIFVDEIYADIIAEIRESLPDLEKVVLIGNGDVHSHERYDEHLADLMSTEEACDLPPEPDDDSMAILMYTGGTTGLPKGVVLDQRALCLTIYRMQPVVGTRAPHNYLGYMPLFHIGGISSWALHLPTGGTVVLLPEFEPESVLAAIRDESITATSGVPTMLAMMLDHPGFEPSMLETLGLILYGAAPMPPRLLDEIMALCPSLGLHQVYGMTEIAAVATGLTPEDHVRGGDILRSVGRPALGVALEIRDPESGKRLPIGEVGEIWLQADSLMTEYWNKPEQTAASLVDGWYKSGDAARIDEQGYVFMADRVKDMIITGGENVYSLEVENAIGSHPQVNQVAVIGLPDSTWGERVHAVVVCEPGTVSAEELEALVRKSIAGFKVPRSWSFQTDPLPLSAAAKVLKRELRDRLATPESD